MLDYKKMQNELEDEYIFRICNMKDKIGSWQDVADILNKELNYNFTSSKYRKPYESGLRMFEANKSKFLSDEYVVEIEKQKSELRSERYKLQALTTFRNRNERIGARVDLFLESLKDNMETLPLPNFRKREHQENDKCYVLGIGDFHYGAKFKSYNNEYSREECERRLGVLVGFVENFVSKNKVSKLKVVNVADSIQGILRLTDLKLNDIAVTESVVEVSRLFAKLVNDISEFCDVEYYHISHSNHSQTRNLGSKANELVAEDLEKIIANYVSDLLSKNDKVKVIFDLNKDYLDIEVFDFNIVAMHGHQVKSVKDALKDYGNLHRKIYDYMLLGHRHSANELIVGEGKSHNLEVITFPSFVGSDPYSDSLSLGAKSMAKIYEFDKVYGHIGNKSIILN